MDQTQTPIYKYLLDNAEERLTSISAFKEDQDEICEDIIQSKRKGRSDDEYICNPFSPAKGMPKVVVSVDNEKQYKLR